MVERHTPDDDMIALEINIRTHGVPLHSLATSIFSSMAFKINQFCLWKEANKVCPG